MKRKYEHKRVWLAPGNPTAMSWAAYTEEEYGETGDIEIQIADCTRVITLQLSSRSDERKIERLICLLEEAQRVRRTKIADEKRRNSA